MKTENLFLILITISNLILVLCIALLNSVLSVQGVFLYLSGLFFLPHYQLLNPYRSLVSLLLTGFLVDHFFNHTFGFHAFSFALIFYFSKEFFTLGKQSFKQIMVFQGCANFILAFVWLLISDWGESTFSRWDFSRFFSDLLISTFFLIPLSLWHSRFCDHVLHRFAPSTFTNFSLRK